MIRYNVEIEYENSGHICPGLTLTEMEELLAQIKASLLVRLSIRRVGGVS
jgi:hypothetical protein